MSTDLYETRTFEEFWETYVCMHAHPTTRALHTAGTISAGLLMGAGLLTGRPLLIVLGPLVDYGLSQLGHRLIEGNVTHPYRNPAWHLRAELRMFRKTLAGTMNAEVARCTAHSTAPAVHGSPRGIPR